MKTKILFILFGILFLITSYAQDASENRHNNLLNRTQWFRDARFGMFIHWGIYAIPAKGEWYKTSAKLTTEEYNKYFEQFNPVDYDPAEWARIAKKAGMKYAVLTVKHHDGFCLFDSKFTDYKSTNTPANRDLVKEFTEAFRAEGIKIGFYYSLVDWHHPEYPPVGNHPQRGKDIDYNKYNWEEYVTYMHNQIEELVTNYGKIDIMWFDFSFDIYKGEKWKATELVNMVRKHQPEIIIDNRLGGDMNKREPEIYAGDFEGPEQIIPGEPLKDELGRMIPWESCITLNNDWGYTPGDYNKDSEDIVRALINCVSKNGNLLLNVGPDARGRIPDKSIQILEEVGEWLTLNGESIYGCRESYLPKPEWGRLTQKGDTLYAHILEKSIGQYVLKGMKGKIEQATLLSDYSEVVFGDFWHGKKFYIDQSDLFFWMAKVPQPQYTAILPDQKSTVVMFILNEED
jgi:alpha-L-fucosidase